MRAWDRPFGSGDAGAGPKARVGRAGALALAATGMLALALGMGCAGVEPPRSLVGQAELAVNTARQATATEHASLELYQAEEKLAQARAAMEDEENLEARRLAEEALLQAQVAEERARSEVARARARELRENIATLRAETERTTRARTRTLEMYGGPSDERSGSSGSEGSGGMQR